VSGKYHGDILLYYHKNIKVSYVEQWCNDTCRDVWESDAWQAGAGNKMQGYEKIGNNMTKHASLHGSGQIVVEADWSMEGGIGQAESLTNEAAQFASMTAQYEKGCEAAGHGFDNVPVTAVFGDLAYMMALAYGCEMKLQGDLVVAVPRYGEGSDLSPISAPTNIAERGLYPLTLERIARFQERWPHIPLTICDNQSPIDVVTSLIHSEAAMLLLYDEPERMFEILDGVTDSIIRINRVFEKTIKNFGGFQSSHYLPKGMHVSDDTAAYLSPDLYARFASPYNRRLAEEFGGIRFHCCMNHDFNLKNFSDTPGFEGFDAMPDYNALDKVLDAIRGKGIWHIYNYGFAKKANRPETDEETFYRLMDATNGVCGMRITVYHPIKEEALRLADKVKNRAVSLGRSEG